MGYKKIAIRRETDKNTLVNLDGDRKKLLVVLFKNVKTKTKK